MTTSLTWGCECGAVQAELPTNGVRIVCYCQSCREHATRLGKHDRLDQWGGSDLMQVEPHKVSFTQGAEHLRRFRITEKGPLRWFTGCCNTPVANTLGSKNFPFASFQVHDAAPKDALPEISARVNLKGATSQVDAKSGSVLGLVAKFAGRAVKARINGNWKTNPFFDENGKPIGDRLDPPPA